MLSNDAAATIAAWSTAGGVTATQSSVQTHCNGDSTMLLYLEALAAKIKALHPSGPPQ